MTFRRLSAPLLIGLPVALYACRPDDAEFAGSEPIEEGEPTVDTPADPGAPDPQVIGPEQADGGVADGAPPSDLGKSTFIFAADGTRAGLAGAFAKAPKAGRIVVVVPPGAFAYGNATSFGSLRSDVTLIGAGAASTRLYRSTEELAPVLAFAKSKNVRVAELTVDGNPAANTVSAAQGIRFTDVVDLRADHVALSRHGASGIRVEGASKGVVDHATLSNIHKAAIGNTLGYGVVVRGIRKIENVAFGTDRATFVEDSTFRRCRHAVASNDGARYVFRFNRVTDNVVSHAVDAHGQEFGSLVGTEWIDVHDNVIGSPATYSLNAIRSRGGKGLVWNNTISGYTNGVSLLEDTPQQTGPIYIFGNKVAGDLYDVSGGATAVLSKPAGYVPYPHPHPLVTRVVAVAGADQKVVAAATGKAVVKLDATKSTAAVGALTHYRWFSKSGFLGSGAAISVELPTGKHLVVLEVERADGEVSHDTLLVDVAPL